MREWPPFEREDVFSIRCTLKRFYGKGNGTFQNPQYFAAGFGLGSLSIADVNGDEEPDIVTAYEFFDEVSVLLRQ